MAEPTLAEVFPGATQTATDITIPKSALTTLTAETENRGDSISAALLITLKDFYIPEKRTADPNISITSDLGRVSVDINFETGINYLNRPIEFNLYSNLDLPELDADSY